MTMSADTHPWEKRLLALAYAALAAETSEFVQTEDSAALSHAYQHCDDITRVNSRTFYLASKLLPIEKRCAARALYAFSRITDDIVDRNKDKPVDDILHELNHWNKIALENHPESNDPVPLAWADSRQRFNIPLAYAEQLIHGITRDLMQTRYDTFADLATYCYGVACTVGLMSMHITGFSGPEAIPYAIRLGVALQMTNILRDIGEDWQAGRLYLPLEELAAFKLSEEDIARGIVDSRWREFMRFQINRNRQLYAEALPGIGLLNPDGRLAIQASGELYRGILDDIEHHDYNVFRRRAHVTTMSKLARLPGIWWRARHHQRLSLSIQEQL
jgi:15-cis-phytoene synthase